MMKKPLVAAQLFTIRDFTKTPEDLDKSMEKIRSIGYKAVQVSGIGPMDHQQVKDIMDKHGLTICATHISFDKMQEDLEDVIYQHKLWDCKYVGVGSMPDKYRASKEGYLAFAKDASEIGKRLADEGLQFIYHNHHFEFVKFDGVLGMDILLNESDPETFGFEIDTFWVQTGGCSPVDWINKVAGRMQVVHFKDMAIDKDEIKPVMAEVGEGNLNWPDIIDACSKTNVEWAAVEQDICKRDPFESLEISLKNLKELGLDS
ncbi:MAG: sugar phosphate isomerase/epimerase [Caldicoprobacterales bacterium]